MSTFTHHGPWNDHSRQSPTLHFLETYFTALDSLTLPSTPPSKFYSPFATYHDPQSNTYTSSPKIFAYLKRLFTPFDRVHHDVVEVRVVSEGGGKGKDVVYAEFLTRLGFRGDAGEVVVPMFFVYGVEEEEGEGEGEGEGKRICEVRGWWDTGILGRYVTERKRRGALR
jgi:hypothetical protein